MHHILKQFNSLGLVFTLCLCTYAYAFPIASHNTLIDRTVAVVNEQVITQRQLNKKIEDVKHYFKRAHRTLPEKNDLKTLALNQLIGTSLQLQLAQNAGIRANDKAVEDALKNRLDHEKHTQAQLSHELTQEGSSLARYKKELRDELTISELHRIMVGPNVELSKAEINRGWHDYQAWRQQHTQYRFQDTMIPLQSGASQATRKAAKKQAQDRAVLLRKKAPIPHDSTIVVKDWDMQAASQLPKQFAKALGRMKVGHIHAPIQTDNGFHILYLLDKKEPKQPLLTRDQIANQLHMQKFMAAVQTWVNKQAKMAYIKRLDE